MGRSALFCVLGVVIGLAGCDTVENVGQKVSASFADLRQALFSSPEQVSTPRPAQTAQSSDVVVSRPVPDQKDFVRVSGHVRPEAVVDGDTIRLAGKRIRLHGIDAPESTQECIEEGAVIPCGTMARYAVIGFVTGATVTCTRLDVDRYGRDVSTCDADGFDLSAGLVAAGLAVAYRQYSLTYVGAEEEAKRNKRGMWRGSFDMPWDWRAKRRGGGS